MNFIANLESVKLKYDKIKIVVVEEPDSPNISSVHYSAFIPGSIVSNLREALSLKFPDYKKELIRRELVGLIGNIAVKKAFGQSVEDAKAMLNGFFTDNPNRDTEFLNGRRYVTKTSGFGTLHRFSKDYTKDERHDLVIFASADDAKNGGLRIRIEGWTQMEKVRHWLRPIRDGHGATVKDTLGLCLHKLCELTEKSLYDALSSITYLLSESNIKKRGSARQLQSGIKRLA